MKEKGLIPAADPVNGIACRSQYGSANSAAILATAVSTNPAAILGPAILATAVSTAVVIVFCKVTDRS